MAQFRVILKDGREFQVNAEDWAYQRLADHLAPSVEFHKIAGKQGPGNQHIAAVIRVEELAAIIDVSAQPSRPKATAV